MKYLTSKRLSEIDNMLRPLEREILEGFRKLRYLKAAQVERLFIHRKMTSRARVATASRFLNRLKSYGLLDHYSKSISGAWKGTNGYVWFLTSAGSRLLDLSKSHEGVRIRYLDPSPPFLRHTLAVSECYTQITEICRFKSEMTLVRLDVEPECWRNYQKDGKKVSVRPDLFAAINSPEYEFRWFIEMDLDTESLDTIIDKCRRYQAYYQTNKEQSDGHVFPYVLWIVPTAERKERIIDAIRFNFGNRYVRFNIVITPNELWNVIVEGVRKEDLC